MTSETALTVSVVIPTYNHAPMLLEALRSVQAQTFTGWEAVVINNFSTDNTIQVVESFHDPRIRLVNFRNNGVIAASRNVGIRKAHGNLIAFLDSDDVWYPEKLERCLARFADGADLVCHAELWREDGVERHEVCYGPASRSDYKSLLYKGNCLSTSAVVVKKTVLEMVGCFSENPSIVTAEDYDLWLNLARNGCRMAFIRDALGEYRIHCSNESKGVIRNANAILYVMDHHYRQLESIGQADQKRIKDRRAHLLASVAVQLFRGGQLLNAINYAFKATKEAPLFPLSLMLRNC